MQFYNFLLLVDIYVVTFLDFILLCYLDFLLWFLLFAFSLVIASVFVCFDPPTTGIRAWHNCNGLSGDSWYQSDGLDPNNWY